MCPVLTSHSPPSTSHHTRSVPREATWAGRFSRQMADAETERLLEIAERCPVHKTLEKTSVIRSQISHKTITGEGSS